MSVAIETRAEIVKLARLLRREPDDLHYLHDVAAEDIRTLREQVTEVLFSAHGQALGRLAAASKLLPVALVATIGEHVFGPLLSARIAGLIEPGRAVEMAERLPVAFLADIAVELDPRRTSEVIARIPPARIAEISHELIRRQEYVTMGRFVGYLDEQAIAAAVAVLDDAALLHVAFVLESKDSLRELLALLGPERLDGIIAAAQAHGMENEALALLPFLDARGRRRVSARLAAAGAPQAATAA